MSRSFGVTLSAILLLLGSLFLLLMGTLFVAVALSDFPSGQFPPEAKYFLLLIPLFLLGVSVWGITTAVGLFRLQPWARYSILVIGGLLAFYGVTSLPFFFFARELFPEEASPEMISTVLLGVGAFYSTLAAVGGWWLYFFSRSGVRNQFMPEELERTAPLTRPLSLTVIACFLILGACFFPALIAMRLPAAFLTTVVTGWKAALIYGLFAAVQLFLAIGLLKGVPVSRTLAVYYFVFTVVHGLVFEFFPGREERWAALMGSMPPEFQSSAAATPEPSEWATLVMVSATAGLALWFLVTRKASFLAYAQARRAARELTPQ
ncbi:MAG: hypothetical protein ACE5HL_10955 [Terriglobia bacterium]